MTGTDRHIAVPGTTERSSLGRNRSMRSYRAILMRPISCWSKWGTGD